MGGPWLFGHLIGTADPELGPLMYAMMASLLAVLEERAQDALELMLKVPAFEEPEARFYLARHCGMLNALEPAVEMAIHFCHMA